VFVGHQVLLNVRFDAARARLANLVHDDQLETASRDSYGKAVTGLARVSPPGPVAELSELVRVQVRDLVTGQGSAAVTLRWQATGSGVPVPVLDADITLTPAGDQATVLRLDATYRPPPGIAGAGLDRTYLRRMATATVQDFLSRIAAAIADPAAAPRSKAAPGEPEVSRPPAADLP
jgi:hypothetical protein